MCSIKTEYRTDQLINSEATMIANQNFYDILNQVQNSQLNYHLQLSPFSAIISLKKSLIKDRTGCLILPSNANHVVNGKRILDEKVTLENKL